MSKLWGAVHRNGRILFPRRITTGSINNFFTESITHNIIMHHSFYAKIKSTLFYPKNGVRTNMRAINKSTRLAAGRATAR